MFLQVPTFGQPQCMSFCNFFKTYSSQALDNREGVQGSGIWKVGVLVATEDSKGCRYYFAPTSVTPEQGGLRVGSSSTGIASHLT